MIKTFKEKAPTVQAVEFTSALSQSPEVANLIGATSMSVDMTTKCTVFTVPMVGLIDPAGPQSNSYTVTEGQVVGLIGAQVVVMAAADFYAKYEQL